MKNNAHALKAKQAERCRGIMYRDHVRMAENHAFYLTQLPKREKTSIIVPSRINQDLCKIRRLAA